MSLSLSLSLSLLYIYFLLLLPSTSSFLSPCCCFIYTHARSRGKDLSAVGVTVIAGPHRLFSSSFFFSFSCFSPHHFSRCNLPIAGEKRKKQWEEEEEEEKYTFTVSINVFKRTRATTVCEEEEGRIENQPRKESPKRKKKLYVRSKRERRGQFKLIRPRSQTTINTIFFLLLLPSSFWVEGYFICSDSFFLYARKLSLFFFFSFSFEQIKRPALCIHTHTIFDGHHSSFNLAKICFVLRF